MNKKLAAVFLIILCTAATAEAGWFDDKSVPNEKIIEAQKLHTDAAEFIRTGRYVEALINYEKAVAILPDEPNFFYNMGIAHYMLKDYEKALADYNKAIGLKHKFPKAYANLALTQAKLNKNEEARASFLTSLKEDSKDGPVNFSYGVFEFSQANFDTAIEYLEKAAKKNPSFPEGYAWLGRCWFQKNDYQKAWDFTHKALAIDPKSVDQNFLKELGDKMPEPPVEKPQPRLMTEEDLDKKLSASPFKNLPASTYNKPKKQK